MPPSIQGYSVGNDELSVFDLNATLRRLGGDTGLLADLIRVYDEDSPDLLRRLSSGIENGQFDQIRRAAHSLRGLAANFGATNLTQHLHRLEEKSATAQLEDGQKVFKTIQQESARLLAALARYSR